jgi:hypothetical protein
MFLVLVRWNMEDALQADKGSHWSVVGGLLFPAIAWWKIIGPSADEEAIGGTQNQEALNLGSSVTLAQG